VLDIILNERLYCSSYDKLNDPFEGTFLTIINLSYQMMPRAFSPLFYRQQKIKKYKNIEELPYDFSKSRICSLSSDNKDVRLWSYYANGHKGLAFEIDFAGLESNLHEVIYTEELPEFGDTLLTSPKPAEVLTRKTKHWKYEAEHRIFCEDSYFPIKDRIKAIYLGSRIGKLYIELLKKMVPNEIPIYSTTFNMEKIQVMRDKQINKAGT
jgi:hypothetical protein